MKDPLTLVRFFDVGINEEGYWNYNQIALQVEDVFDVLAIKYPQYDIVLLMDQSSGHGKMRDGALNANVMSVRYGGKQGKLRKTKIREIGTYRRILDIGDEQLMVFGDDDDGPFYLTPEDRIRMKYDRFSGVTKTIEKNKKKLMDELKQKGFLVRRYYGKEELQKIAQEMGIELTYNHQEVIEGWCGRPKGMLQVLWERGHINEAELDKYSGDGKKIYKDDEGKIKPQYEKYVLRTLMKNCLDFLEEESAMEVLLSTLSTKQQNQPSIRLLTSPKYHCELAGEGIEFCWGLQKRFYRNIPIKRKNTKKEFAKCVRDAVEFVRKEHVIRFAGMCRRYMMAYNAFDENGDVLTYKAVERFVRKTKTHRNIADQEKGEIERVWKESAL